MKHNIGSTDQFVRFLLTVIIAIIGIHYKSYWGFLAIVPFLTASVLYCPVYKIFGANTSGKKEAE